MIQAHTYLLVSWTHDSQKG